MADVKGATRLAYLHVIAAVNELEVWLPEVLPALTSADVGEVHRRLEALLPKPEVSHGTVGS